LRQARPRWCAIRRLLVDTQIWLWMLASPERFSAEGREVVESASTELLLSAASAWEIAIKYSLGKLSLPESPEEYVPRLLRKTRTDALPVQHAHALRAAGLPLHHRGPFDRLIIAQAQVEGLPIMSADPHFAAYDVELVGV
jgi:PIN domain nuclease of toxin-antitoxin system